MVGYFFFFQVTIRVLHRVSKATILAILTKILKNVFLLVFKLAYKVMGYIKASYTNVSLFLVLAP